MFTKILAPFMGRKIVIKFDRNGNVVKTKGDVGFTRRSNAANELHRHETEPTFLYKILRFIKRLDITLRVKAERAADYVTYTPPVNKEPCIRLLEEHNAG